MKSSVTFAVCGIAILFLVLASECKPALDDPLLTTVQATTTTDPATVDDLKDIPDHLIDYLVKYGYIIEKRIFRLYNKSANHKDKLAYTRGELEAALRDFQHFMRIPATGKMDRQTYEKVKQKRCGMPDKTPRDDLKVTIKLTKSGKYKRRVLFNGKAFNTPVKKVFYWTLNPYPLDTPESILWPNIWHAMEYAFNRWASITNVVFIRGDGLGFSDILVGFWKGAHGDDSPFDGNGGNIAHANMNRGNIHFDDEEDWNVNPEEIFLWRHPRNGTDFIKAAVHEIGHILGLPHIDDAKSVMNPTMLASTPNSLYKLGEMDMNRVQASYGSCEPDKIDGMFTNSFLDGKTYMFKGPFIYQLNNADRRVEQAWPRATTLPFFSTTFVDEAFWHTDHFLYFFDEERYFIFDSSSNPHYHRAGIYKLGVNFNGDVGWRGLKHFRYIDAAMNMMYEGKLTSFIFQDEWVYKWDVDTMTHTRMLIPSEIPSPGWPKKSTDVFPGIPTRIDTALTWGYDGNTYFIKGQYQWIWNKKLKKAEGPYHVFKNGWKNVCDIYLCQVSPKVRIYNCESWQLTKDTCYGMCQ